MNDDKQQYRPSSLPTLGMDGYSDLPQFSTPLPLPFRRTIRRKELHQIVPLVETTIYEMEQRRELPLRLQGLRLQCQVGEVGTFDRTAPPEVHQQATGNGGQIGAWRAQDSR